MQLRFTLLRTIQHLPQNLFRVSWGHKWTTPQQTSFIVRNWEYLITGSLQIFLTFWFLSPRGFYMHSNNLHSYMLHPLYLFFIWCAVQRSTGIEFLKFRYNVHNEMSVIGLPDFVRLPDCEGRSFIHISTVCRHVTNINVFHILIKSFGCGDMLPVLNFSFVSY